MLHAWLDLQQIICNSDTASASAMGWGRGRGTGEMSPAHPHICHRKHRSRLRRRQEANSSEPSTRLWGSGCCTVSWYLMRSSGNRPLYWDELSVLSSISFVTYLTVWQVELITPDRIYPKWLKLPHLESQGGRRIGGRELRQNRKKLGLSWWMMFVMGEAIFFPNMETGKILNMKKNWVYSSFPYLWLSHILWENIGGHLICSLALTTADFLQAPSTACSAF